MYYTDNEEFSPARAYGDRVIFIKMDVEIKEVKKLIKERAGVKYVGRTIRRERRESERGRERAREGEREREGGGKYCTHLHKS